MEQPVSGCAGRPPAPTGGPAGALPVLVAGAGPVGLTAALLLARFGVPTVVLEAKPGREPIGSKSICVQRDVLDVYHRAGCAAALMAEGVTWHRGRTFYRGQELFTVTFPDPGRSAYPGFINIGQQRVEYHLAAAVAGEPLIDLRYGYQVVGVDQDRDTVTVTARPTGTPAAGPVEVTGSHLIAADGPRSTVRGLLGLDFAGHSFDDLFLIADVRVDLPFGAERQFHFDPDWNPGRQVLVHPQPDSVWRIDWQVPSEYDLAADRAGGQLDARIRRIVGDRDYEIVWLSVYRFHQRLASRFRVGRVLLAGDAAHLMSPFGARGLNSGVQDAENAAWKIAYQRCGWAGPGLLDSYQVERRAAAVENLRVTGETMRFLLPQTGADRARRREVLARAVTDPAARHLVNSGKLAEPYWYLDSPLTTTTVDVHDFPGEPGRSRPPVAGVLCPDGPCRVAGSAVTRLRELFGRQPVLLWSGGPGAGSPVVAAPMPVGRYRLEEIDTDGVLATALDARPGRCWLVRPDGHLAAVLDRPSGAELAAAVRRMLGHPGDPAVPGGT